MKFSFVIITGGDSASVNRLIDSIESQNIPADSYEIIVIGGEMGDLVNRKNLLHCCFDESRKANWITKKKMLGVERASFENIVITHDYIVLDPGWYDGWVKFGDDWDVAMNAMYNGDGERFRDWLTHDPHAMVPYDIVGYHPTMYISGTYWVAKKQFMLSNSLDLSRGWCEAEDLEWSYRCRPFWRYKMNAKASVRSTKLKETWQILDHNGVQTNIHYKHFVTVLNAISDIKVSDDNGWLSVRADPGVRSIHYTDFDLIRHDIRRLKPKNIVVVGDPFGLTGFAASWVAKEIGSNVTIADYVEGWGTKINKVLTKQFEWEGHTSHAIISSPEELSFSGTDMMILGGTYGDDVKLREIAALKKVFAAKGSAFVYNTLTDDIKKELPGGAHSGCFYRAGVTK